MIVEPRVQCCDCTHGCAASSYVASRRDGGACTTQINGGRNTGPQGPHPRRSRTTAVGVEEVERLLDLCKLFVIQLLRRHEHDGGKRNRRYTPHPHSPKYPTHKPRPSVGCRHGRWRAQPQVSSEASLTGTGARCPGRLAGDAADRRGVVFSARAACSRHDRHVHQHRRGVQPSETTATAHTTATAPAQAQGTAPRQGHD